MSEGSRVKNGKGLIVFAIVSLFLVAVFIASYFYNESEQGVLTNQNVINTGYFNVEYAETGTNASGSFFLIDDGGDLRMKIISTLHVGPDDVCGIAFNFPQSCQVTNIMYDYGGKDCVSLWTNGGDDTEITSFIEIDNGLRTLPSGGGDGAIEIELDVTNDVQETYFIVGLGSTTREDGTIVSHPASEKITVSR